jgi:glycosyltransferase involved in cell wall biosynthesis
MDISVVTPSLNMLPYLKRCVSSVADQVGVSCEHVIMDGGSSDGTVEWLDRHQSLVSEVKRDNGLYDAVNRGFRLARGRILAHLNSDEQYLPGTLEFVTRYFDAHPGVDLIFGDTLTIRPDGALVAYRKTIRPMAPVLTLPPLYVETAATFFRRHIIESGHVYDDSFKVTADLVWIQRLVRSNYRLEHVGRYLSAFTMTGYNKSQVDPGVALEIERCLADVPWWIKRFRGEWRIVGWAQKFLAGCYRQATPLIYALYTSEDAFTRKELVAEKVSFRWRA